MTNEAKVLLGVGVVTILLIVGAVFLLGQPGKKVTSNAELVSDPSLLIKPDSNKIATDSAKVTIVEFGDYQCPACGQAYPIVKKVLTDYSGKVNFVFRNFPLPQHKNALMAAEVAEAAGSQGKFWQMHDKLYEGQSEWGENDKAVDILVGYAQQLGLDTNKLKQEVLENKFSAKITGDQNDGNSAGVNATPTFFIDGQKLEGAPSYDNMKSRIDSELAKTK